MKYILMTVTLLVGLCSLAQQNQADPGRSLTNPSDSLQENDCVFKNKGVVALQAYELIVDKCDRRYSPSLLIISDHLPQGGCVYNVVQKMTGHTIARVVNMCPQANNNQDIQAIIPDAPLEQIEDAGDHMPQIPGAEAQAKKPKAKPQQPQAAAAKPAVAKKKDEVKPKTNEQVEKGNDGYYLNPDEIEF